jgi:hypothetical protein
MAMSVDGAQIDAPDLTGEEWARDPWSRYAAWREGGDVRWSPRHRSWFVFGHAAVREGLRSTGLRSDYAFRATRQAFGPTIVDLEGPEHERLRPPTTARLGTQYLRQDASGWLDQLAGERVGTFVARGGGEVVFLGDSITERWESTGAKAWRKTFVPLKAINLGVGGDQTGHVLWRVGEGMELEPLSPRLAVVLVGINNPVAHSPDDVAGGVQAVVAELKRQKPQIKVLVLGVFPCSLRRQDPAVQRIGPADLQPRVQKINAALGKLHDGTTVFFKDIGNKFLEEDGGLSRQVLSDFLHLAPKGYEIWADAIKEDVEKLLR